MQYHCTCVNRNHFNHIMCNKLCGKHAITKLPVICYKRQIYNAKFRTILKKIEGLVTGPDK